MTSYELHLGDCLEYMQGIPNGSVDAVITDPPYGIKAGKMNMGFSQSSRIEKSNWDDIPPTKKDIEQVLKLGSVQIIWGGNYFDLPPSRCFLVWDKGASFKNRSFSECEMAWTNQDAPARVFNRNPLANGDYKDRLHKTQKPIALMKWCIESYTEPNDTVFDPFMGSGTTGVACMLTGRNFIGCEIDPDYFAIAEERIKLAQSQLRLGI